MKNPIAIVWVLLTLATPLLARSQAARSGNLNGSVETGFVFGGPPRDSQWLIDQLEWNQRFDGSERVRFVFNNSVAVQSPTGLAGFNNSVNYFSPLRLTGTNFTLASSGAYLEARVADGVGFSLGHFRIPFGMEAVTSRYDSMTYFYSAAFTQAQAGRWLWNLGMQAEITRIIPGTLTVSLVDGRSAAGEASPALALHYEFSYDRGGYSLIPSVSGYVGKLSGGLRDVGFTGGFQWLAGRFSLASELILVRQDGVPFGGTYEQSTSVYVEPTYDFGIAEIGLKGEWLYNGSFNDLNLGVALTKSFSDRLRLRVLFQTAGLRGNVRAGQQDLRIFLGTHW